MVMGPGFQRITIYHREIKKNIHVDPHALNHLLFEIPFHLNKITFLAMKNIKRSYILFFFKGRMNNNWLRTLQRFFSSMQNPCCNMKYANIYLNLMVMYGTSACDSASARRFRLVVFKVNLPMHHALYGGGGRKIFFMVNCKTPNGPFVYCSLLLHRYKITHLSTGSLSHECTVYCFNISRTDEERFQIKSSMPIPLDPIFWNNFDVGTSNTSNTETKWIRKDFCVSYLWSLPFSWENEN